MRDDFQSSAEENRGGVLLSQAPWGYCTNIRVNPRSGDLRQTKIRVSPKYDIWAKQAPY